MNRTRKLLKKRILLTGGGSGGHVSPIKGLIDELYSRYSNAHRNILFVGGKPTTGSDYEKTYEQTHFENREDINFVAIRTGKLDRKFRFISLIKLLSVCNRMLFIFGLI